jgi:hypothetical protein
MVRWTATRSSTSSLQFEGGFVNNAADHGGPTNFGIAAATLGRTRGLGRAATVDEVRALSRSDAAAIYKKSYLSGPGFDSIGNVNTRLILVDTASCMVRRVRSRSCDNVLGYRRRRSRLPNSTPRRSRPRRNTPTLAVLQAICLVCG